MKKGLLVLFVVITQVFNASAQVVLYENFEGAVFPPAGWVIVNSGAGNDWMVNTNSAYASSGTKSMMYTFTSAAPASTWAFTPGIQLDSADSVTITFDQRVGLSNLAEALKVTVGSTQAVASQTIILYNNNNLTNTLYTQRSATFKPDSAGTYYFAFNCYSPADRFKLYIDNIRIFKPITKDVALVSLSAVESGCSLGSVESVSILIKNNGIDTVSNFSVNYTVNNGFPVTENIASPIAPGSTLSYLYATAVDLSAPGIYSIKVYTALPDDGDPYNDTLTQVTENIQGGLPVKSSDTQVVIPDNNPAGANSIITFCGLPAELNGASCEIDYLKIDSINHSWISDLTVYLISPVNDSLLVSQENGGGNFNITNVVFADSATTNIGTVNSGGIPSGLYHTEEIAGLAAFNTGQNPNGDWRLCVKDNVSGDIGKICKWTLAFRGVTSTAVNLREGEDILVYPNPSERFITLDLINHIDLSRISVMNAYGSIVYYKTIEQSASKRINLDLGELKKGIYFIQVRASGKNFTKKIIID